VRNPDKLRHAPNAAPAARANPTSGLGD